jgi:cation:H+ antiporter
MTDLVLALAAGVVFAAGGGELFVRGAVGLAQWARIPAGIIGATVAAFATSSPELAVAVSSSLAGHPEIALGDALGSNVANVGLILGVALLFGAVQSPRDSVRRDFPVAIAAPILVALVTLDGRLSRLDAAALLVVFAGWLAMTIREARRQRSATAAVLGEKGHGAAAVQSVVGLVLLILAGRLIVHGARGVALAAGLDELVVGATVVAVATSTPELATTLVARWRGHDEVGLGTILGSNVFNTLFIIGVAGMMHPIETAWRGVAVAAGLGVLTLAAAFPPATGLIPRGRGFMLVALWIAFIAIVLQVGAH